VTPSVAAPGDTNPSDATVSLSAQCDLQSEARHPHHQQMLQDGTRHGRSWMSWLHDDVISSWCHDLYFIVHFIFRIANCLLCILYRLFLLYPRPTVLIFYTCICRILL